MSGAPPRASSRRARTMSAARWTKLTATMSTPIDTPKFRSSISFSVMADAGSDTPGALMPLCCPSRPPSTTAVWISSPLVDSTFSSIAPSARSRRSPGRTLSARPSNDVETRPGPPTNVPVAIRSSSPTCRSSATPPWSGPVLILGPDRSCRIATSRPARVATARTRASVAPWVSCVPCEKFNRMISVPALMSVSSTASESLAGPTVAIILVWRM